MITNLANNNNQSPFDSIRRFDETGGEFWTARDLMSVMGYQKWERFTNPVQQAIENLEINEDNVVDHVSRYWEASGKTERENYKFSRYACYMVALCCDGRKIEVASAKKYFAIKTRQAEVVIPAQDTELEKLKMQNEVLGKQLELRQLDHTMLLMHGKETVLALRGMADQIVETEKPTIEVIDAQHNVSFKGQTLTQVKEYALKRYGLKFKSGADIKRLLESKGHSGLIAQTKRSVISDYIPEENLEQLYRVLNNNKSRQMLLGE